MLNKIHAYLGLALVLPLFVWAVTGLIFMLKPGYDAAYEQLSVAQSPLNSAIALQPRADWRQLRFLRSAIGDHLLVTTAEGKILHLDPATLAPRARPNEQQLEQLFLSATGHNRQRYGEIATVEKTAQSLRMQTSTQIQLDLHWPSLQLQQTGADTRFIDRLYRMHYLQWTPSPLLNGAAVLFALVALLFMCFVGLRMLIQFHQKEQS